MAADVPPLPVFDASRLPEAPAFSRPPTCPGPLLVPVWPEEGTVLDLSGRWWKPNAVKVLVDGLNAITGLPGEPEKGWEDGDYLVVGESARLDGIRTADGRRRPLAPGRDRGGLELLLAVAEPKPGLFPDRPPRNRGPLVVDRHTWGAISVLSVHLIHPCKFARLTGLPAPPPASAPALHAAGIPVETLCEVTAGGPPGQGKAFEGSRNGHALRKRGSGRNPAGRRRP